MLGHVKELVTLRIPVKLYCAKTDLKDCKSVNIKTENRKCWLDRHKQERYINFITKECIDREAEELRKNVMK